MKPTVTIVPPLKKVPPRKVTLTMSLEQAGDLRRVLEDNTSRPQYETWELMIALQSAGV